MNKKRVTIITGSGVGLGQGHLQRMLSLADYIRNDFMVDLVVRGDSPVPENFKSMKTEDVPENTDLIIRDMRDSSAEEMRALQKTAPVAAVDDAGEGRHTADHIIDLLPNLLRDCSFTPGQFICGYNFTSRISSYINSLPEKDIDFTVYAGTPPAEKIIAFIKKSVPAGSKTIVLGGEEPFDPVTGEKYPGLLHAGALLRSRFAVTHFGLTMFEANLCGAEIIALNPTDYHSRLTELVSDSMNITNLGKYSSLSTHAGQILYDRYTSGLHTRPPSQEKIKSSLHEGPENFKKFITSAI